MKKKVLTFLLLTLTSAVTQAKILRVNNVAGMAPYSTIADAVRAANDGDTIMVDGSTVEYEKTILNKRVVMVGPGYLQNENSLSNEADCEARIDGIEVQSEGTVIMGMHIGGWYSLEIKAPKVVITRCYIKSWEGILMYAGANNCIFHQNFMLDGISGDKATYYHQFTNNICKGNFSHIYQSHIYYNTFYSGNPVFHLSTGNRIEKNVVPESNFGKGDNENTYADNLVVDGEQLFGKAETDLDVLNGMKQLPASVVNTRGAFAADAPYVISGIPAGPVIEKLSLPASVEEGDRMKITIKLGERQ